MLHPGPTNGLWDFYEVGSTISGDLKNFPEEVFMGHQSGTSGFRYEIPIDEPGKYIISLGFAEVYTTNCEIGSRKMDIYANGKTVATDLDVFAEVGCQTALFVEKEVALIEEDKMNILFQSTMNYPMISAIEIRKSCIGPTPAPTAAPTAAPSSAPTETASAAPSSAPSTVCGPYGEPTPDGTGCQCILGAAVPPPPNDHVGCKSKCDYNYFSACAYTGCQITPEGEKVCPRKCSTKHLYTCGSSRGDDRICVDSGFPWVDDSCECPPGEYLLPGTSGDCYREKETLAPQPAPTCEPTSGSCAASATELQALINAEVSGGNNVVTICDGVTIDTQEVSGGITATDPDRLITLCCEGLDCLLANGGSGRNLEVTAGSVTLMDIGFVGGSAPGEFGGNVKIVSEGGFATIVDCTFQGGSAVLGGNLFLDSTNARVTGCSFSDGSASSAGGGMFVSRRHANDYVIEDSEFNNNSAGTGGGLTVSTMLGDLPSLSVLNSSFNDNVGGAAYISHTITRLDGNSGSGNSGGAFVLGHLQLDSWVQ